jgi:ribosomal protein L37E
MTRQERLGSDCGSCGGGSSRRTRLRRNWDTAAAKRAEISMLRAAIRLLHRGLTPTHARTGPRPSRVDRRVSFCDLRFFAMSSRVDRRATFTRNPDVPAPVLRCPTCDDLLTYRETVLGGVKPPERWDYYDCRRCGLFEFRERTRKFRKIVRLPSDPATR